MNDDRYFLANAYLDGELTADERRIAEADPEVMSEVEQLRALQSELRDVAAPSAEARESAIAAAMAVFGGAVDTTVPTTVPTTEPTETAAPVVPFRPRPSYAKYLGVAAAVVAVAGLGIIVSQAGRGADDAATDSAEPAAEATTERSGALVESLDTADAANSEIMAADDSDDAADEGGADTASEDEMADDGEVANEPAEVSSADMATADAGEAPISDERQYRTLTSAFDPEAPIADADELGEYGVYLITERDSGSLPSTPNHACVDAHQILGTAMLLLDGEPTTVYIDVREADGLVVAVNTETCAELVVGSLYAD